MMLTQRNGFSLAEVLIAIALTGLLAVLMLPKFETSVSDIQSSNLGQVDGELEQVSAAIDLYKNANNVTSVDFSTTSLEYILYNYGNYFAYKQYGTSPTVKYFLMPDGSRLATDPTAFASTSPIKFDSSAATDDYASSTLSSTPCATYNTDECFYIDYNGHYSPNTAGKTGDIIPFRIDPTSDQVQTVYAWVVQDGGSNPCNYVSSYDIWQGQGIGCP